MHTDAIFCLEIRQDLGFIKAAGTPRLYQHCPVAAFQSPSPPFWLGILQTRHGCSMNPAQGIPVGGMTGCGACPTQGCVCRGANEKRGRKSPWISCPSSRESELEEHHPLCKKSYGIFQVFLRGIRVGAMTCMHGCARGFAWSRFPWDLALWKAFGIGRTKVVFRG